MSVRAPPAPATLAARVVVVTNACARRGSAPHRRRSSVVATRTIKVNAAKDDGAVKNPFLADDARGVLEVLANDVREVATNAAKTPTRTRAPSVDGAPSVVAASGNVATWREMMLKSENGSSARLRYAIAPAAHACAVTLTLALDRMEARGSDGANALLHWGVLDRAGAPWRSPYDALREVPANSRAPDAMSCESPFLGAGTKGEETATLTLDAKDDGVGAVVFLVRTQDCKVWFKDASTNGDIIINVRDAVNAARARDSSTVATPASRRSEPEAPKKRTEQKSMASAPPPPPPPPPPPVAAPREPAQTQKVDQQLEFAALNQWRGSEVKLQTHKGGGGERNLRWSTDNLAPAAASIVGGDRDSSSWRQKLQMVEKLLCENGADVDSMAYATVYLFWISVGAIACVEDGTHYRPNHHAGSAERMYGAIEAAERHASEIAQSGDHHRARELRALIRRLHPRLPAFTAEFTQSVPLTRIRDIAHGKGDQHGKCREVRQEIKHTIQNKLHRCAGPEDLVATEAMLAKLTAPGTDYPEEFVNEFKIFYRELKEFFNASSVADRIDRIANEQGAPGTASESSKKFLQAKANVDALSNVDALGDQTVMSTLVECLKAVHNARSDIIGALDHAGDLKNAPSSQRQQWRLAEVSMEDYAFVLLSRLLNTLGAESEPPRSDISASELKLTLEALALTSRTLSLSSGGDQEMEAIASEAATLARDGLPNGEEGGLRVQAIAERARRSAVDFCELLESLFDGRASSLGNALGIDGDSVNVFTEGQIRSSVVFQSAKFASLLLRVSRQITGAAGWDCVVQGTAIGAFKYVDRLTPEACAQFNEPVVLLVANADGDEEVSTLGQNIRGIVLCHALPHLSHLALRARQAHVPLIAVEDDKLVEYARSLMNQGSVKLCAESTGINLEQTNEAGSTSKTSPSTTSTSRVLKQELDADLSKATTVIDLVDLHAMGIDASTRVAGTKSAMCAQLSAIAEKSADETQFLAPRGAVLPFGAMEFACANIGKLEHLESLIVELESPECASDAARTKKLCDNIQNLIRSLKPSESAMDIISFKFGQNARVMVRSSANVEDLEGMSAAGLYDSIPNVDPNNREAFATAVGEVWASLYTTRAVASRHAAGVGQLSAHMCVLVQEMLSPEVSFVLHTTHPLTGDVNSAYAEFALGLGETLASGAIRGTPCRMSIEKSSKNVTVNAFASFGAALVRDDESPTGMKSVAADYATHWLSNDAVKRSSVAARILAIGLMLEHELSPRAELLAQDIEGCVLPNGELCIVQARPQP